ncbi:ketopantoate reductase PanE/ApbA C terminal-domain-containing protein [Peziza echinospora]|nr:ketopantoate reductase PanE/ApbA C terminal-domain-containing protein [Peziza echinospora]
MAVLEVQKPVEVLTYGGGSMGALYSFILARNSIRPVNITIKCRGNYSQVLASGYTITSDLLGTHNFRPHRVVRHTSELLSPNPVTEYDYIFVSTKATIPGGKVDIPPSLVTPGKTSIVLLQNGVGIEEPYKVAFPDTPIISVICYVSVLQPSPSEIRHVGSVDMVVCGLYPPPPPTPTTAKETSDMEKLTHLTEIWSDGGCNAIVAPNIISERWRKTVWNGCWNVICVLTGLDTHSVIESSKYSEELVKSVTLEIVRTARRVLGIDGVDGNEIPGIDEDLKKTWDVEERVGMNLSLAAQTVPITPSMLQDARKGIEMEVEVLCGNIVREAQKHGVDTPILT